MDDIFFDDSTTTWAMSKSWFINTQWHTSSMSCGLANGHTWYKISPIWRPIELLRSGYQWQFGGIRQSIGMFTTSAITKRQSSLIPTKRYIVTCVRAGIRRLMAHIVRLFVIDYISLRIMKRSCWPRISLFEEHRPKESASVFLRDPLAL